MKKIQVSKLKLGKPRRITAGLTDHEHPAVSPDRKHIAFYAGSYGSIGIYIADWKGRLASRVSPEGGNSTQPAWSPNGLKISYRHQATPKDKWQIWEASFYGDTKMKPLLAHEKWHYKHPSYSPDGMKLAYFSDEGNPGVFNLWVYDLAGQTKTRLTDSKERNDCHPVFSPDGERIIFHAYEGVDESKVPPVVNLYELDLASGKARKLTKGKDQYKHPFYLTGGVITYHHERNKDGLRWLEAMDLASGEVVHLTSGEDNDKHPFPARGRGKGMWLAWSSKKLGAELPGEPNTYDIFVARLIAGPPKGKKRSRRIDLPISNDAVEKLETKETKPKPKLKSKPASKICGDCSYKLVKAGKMDSWSQARKFKVKGRRKACKDCPSRAMLG